MKMQEIMDKALNSLDFIGDKLEAYGVTDKVNRHNTLAFLMSEQKRLEGELDSLNAKLDTQIARVEKLRRQAEQVVNVGVETVSAPLRQTIDFIKNRLN